MKFGLNYGEFGVGVGDRGNGLGDPAEILVGDGAIGRSRDCGGALRKAANAPYDILLVQS